MFSRDHWKRFGHIFSLFALFAKKLTSIMRERLGKYKNLIENCKDDWRNEDGLYCKV